MRTTIDTAGRLVIPKPLRDRLGLSGGTEVEISEEDGRLTVQRPLAEIRLQRRGKHLVAVAEGADDIAPLTMADVRGVLEAARDKLP